MAITISAISGKEPWTATWWNPYEYHIQFTFKNDDTNNSVILKNIQWAMVAGNAGNNTINPYAKNLFIGNSCTIAFYNGYEKVSSDVVIPEVKNCNLAQLNTNNEAVLLSGKTVDNNQCFFVPRYHSNFGNLELSGIPDNSQDTVEKVTRNIELLPGVELPAGGSVTLTLKSENFYQGILQVAPINTITVNKGIIWVRENGVWVKKLYPHKYDSATNSWTDLGGHIMKNSEWGNWE